MTVGSRTTADPKKTFRRNEKKITCHLARPFTRKLISDLQPRKISKKKFRSGQIDAIYPTAG